MPNRALTAAVLLAALALTGCAHNEGTPTTNAPLLPAPTPGPRIVQVPEDVKVIGCGHTDPENNAGDQADVTVTNSSREARHFHVTVYFADAAGTRIGSGFIPVWSVAPGETVQDSAPRGDAPLPGITCRAGQALAVPAAEVPQGELWWPMP